MKITKTTKDIKTQISDQIYCLLNEQNPNPEKFISAILLACNECLEESLGRNEEMTKEIEALSGALAQVERELNWKQRECALFASALKRAEQHLAFIGRAGDQNLACSVCCLEQAAEITQVLENFTP